MKAAVYRTNGGPEVLSYEEVPDPDPGSNDVLIEVEAISIEGGDLLHRLRWPLQVVPTIVGYSTAGTVRIVGANVSDLKVGQKVAAFGLEGSHAALRAVRADHCWLLPQGFDPKVAAGLPVAFGTAYEALFELGQLKAGDTVLIQGAAGGVGLAAVQLAKKAGARVIGTGSSAPQLENLRQYGLDDGIDYKTENVLDRVRAIAGKRGVDLVIDPVGGSLLPQVIRSTRNGGRIVLVGGAAREPNMIDATRLILDSKTVIGFNFSDLIHTPRVRDYIASLIQRVAGGELEMAIDRVFPLSEAEAAHRHAEQRGRIGRVVMVP